MIQTIDHTKKGLPCVNQQKYRRGVERSVYSGAKIAFGNVWLIKRPSEFILAKYMCFVATSDHIALFPFTDNSFSDTPRCASEL